MVAILYIQLLIFIEMTVSPCTQQNYNGFLLSIKIQTLDL